MSGSEFLQVLDGVLQGSGLARPPSRAGAPFARLISGIHAQNLSACAEPAAPSAERDRRVTEFDHAVAGAAPPPARPGDPSPGSTVAQISSRYIDLQYALNAPVDGAALAHINRLLTDLVEAKLRLSATFGAAPRPRPEAPRPTDPTPFGFIDL